MGVITEIQYNGELGYKSPIKNVREFFKITISDKDFLDTENPESKLKNRDLIFQAYSMTQKISLGLADIYGTDIKGSESIEPDMLCPIPIVLYVDTNNLSPDVLISQGNVLSDNFQIVDMEGTDDDFRFTIDRDRFYKNVIKRIANESENTHGVKDTTDLEGTRRQNVKPLVWLWSKALNDNGKFNSNSIFNLSPFVENVSVNQTESGGNFSLKLLAIDGVIDIVKGEPSGIWHPDKQKYVSFDHGGKENFMFRNMLNKMGFRQSEDTDDMTSGTRFQNIKIDGYNTRDRKFKDKDQPDFNRTETLFKNLISENDIIFISFSHSGDYFPYVDDFFLDNSWLPEADWQMIGLVDSNQLQVSFESSSMDLSISGRDCMKLLIEDGSYFFAKSFADPDNANTAFSNVDLPNRGDDNNAENITRADVRPMGINRLFSNGQIEVLFNPEARNVNFVMNLLMSRLSNIEICHDELFQYYGDRRTTFQIPIYEIEELEEGDTKDDIDN